jgi:hypothetical protein
MTTKTWKQSSSHHPIPPSVPYPHVHVHHSADSENISAETTNHNVNILALFAKKKVREYIEE